MVFIVRVSIISASSLPRRYPGVLPSVPFSIAETSAEMGCVFVGDLYYFGPGSFGRYPAKADKGSNQSVRAGTPFLNEDEEWMYLIPLRAILLNAMAQAVNMADEPGTGQPGSQAQQAITGMGQPAAVFPIIPFGFQSAKLRFVILLYLMKTKHHLNIQQALNFTKGGELRPYQLEGLQWMLSLFNNNLNGSLADEMGLGKTIQTISLIAYLLENKGVSGPHLIVALKVVLPKWINVFTTSAPGISAVLYDGRQDERKALSEEYSGEGKFNDSGFGYQIQRRLVLTGTPIRNSLQELWSLFNFLLPNIFNSVENFEEWFNAPFSDKSDVSSFTDEEQLLVIGRLHHVIRPFILRRKKDEVEKYLPSKTQVILKCAMSGRKHITSKLQKWEGLV